MNTERVEYIPLPILVRPFVGLVAALLGLLALAVAAFFILTLPVTMLFVPRVKVTYKK